MRVSKLFGKTLRDDPSEAELTSHKLMLKAGMIYQAAAGIYAYSAGVAVSQENRADYP